VKILGRVRLHPYLIGIFPVLSLYAHNQSELDPDAPWRPLGVILFGTTVTLLILRLFFKDWLKASLITSYASLVFFLYNPAREVLHNIHTSNFNLGWNRYFFLFGFLFLFTRLGDCGFPYENTTQIFNVVALSTILLPSFSVIYYAISQYLVNNTESTNNFTVENAAPMENAPDIYYIILDMYGRSDTIEQEFGYDNSPLLNELRNQGFYVASCSTSNYSHTVLSLTSSLNMDFLPAFTEDPVAGNADSFNATMAIRNNAVRRYLQAYGYSFVSFESSFPYLNIPDSDIYIRIPERKIASSHSNSCSLSKRLQNYYR
jgi:hypothetical protein